MAVVPQVRRRRTTLVALLLLSITVLTFDIRGNGVIDGARETARDAFSPVAAVARAAFSPFEGTWHAIFDYDDVKKENERLQQAIADAQGQVAAAQRSIIENQELRAQLGLSTQTYLSAFPSVTAQVLDPSPSNFDHAVEIDKGANSGVKVGMAVMAPDGVVGRITKVADDRSIVRLLNDPELFVGVKITSTEGATIEQGTAYGRGVDEPLGVENIGNDADLKPGDPVYTSGADAKSLFPADLPLGEVVSADKEPGGVEQRVLARPNTDLGHLTFVRVILEVPG